MAGHGAGAARSAEHPTSCGALCTVALVLAALGASCTEHEPTPGSSHPVVSWNAEDLDQWRLAGDGNFQLDEKEIGFLVNQPRGLLGASGLVVVADRGNNRILVLDSVGRLQRTVGRKGEGPLEFIELTSLSRWPGDSVFAFDARSRFSVFSPETGEGRTVTFDGMMAPLVARPGPEPNELWLVEGAHFYPGQLGLGKQRLPYHVARWRPPDSVGRIATVAGPEFHVDRRGPVDSPLRPTTTFAAANGVLFVSEGDPRLTVLDGTAEVRLEVRIAGTGVELAGEVRSRVVDSLYALVALTRVRMAARLQKAPLPDVAEGFHAMALGRDGTLWLGAWNIPGIEHRLWVNLEQDGTPVRRLRLPRSVVVMDADGDRLLVRRWNDLGVYDVDVRRIVAQQRPQRGGGSGD